METQQTMQQIERLVVPGTFDPVTYGHMDVIRRARMLCPDVVVAVAASQGKNGTGPTFSLEERVAMLREALDADGLADVAAKPVRGLLMDFCHAEGAQAVVKGLRATTDFEYELQQANLNCRISPDVESIFVMSSPSYSYVSSSIVRELAGYGSDVSALVPPTVERRLRAHFGCGSAR